MEKIIGLKEVRENVDRFVAGVRRGDTYIVVRRSTPLFRLSPIDNEEWETVIDFTRIKRGGVPIADILKRL